LIKILTLHVIVLSLLKVNLLRHKKFKILIRISMTNGDFFRPWKENKTKKEENHLLMKMILTII